MLNTNSNSNLLTDSKHNIITDANSLSVSDSVTNSHNNKNNNKNEISPLIEKLTTDQINLIESEICLTDYYGVIKELIENSIDGNSTIIKIYINTDVNNSKNNKNNIIIKVSDNGIGISNIKDINFNCSSKLETSEIQFKLITNNNIGNNNKSTYGFRGRALASLAYQSDLEITSCVFNSLLNNNINNKAFSYNFTTKIYSESIRDHGTTVTVRNLFKRSRLRQEKCINISKVVEKVKEYLIYYSDSNTNYSKVTLPTPPCISSSLASSIPEPLYNSTNNGSLPTMPSLSVNKLEDKINHINNLNNNINISVYLNNSLYYNNNVFSISKSLYKQSKNILHLKDDLFDILYFTPIINNNSNNNNSINKNYIFANKHLLSSAHSSKLSSILNKIYLQFHPYPSLYICKLKSLFKVFNPKKDKIKLSDEYLKIFESKLINKLRQSVLDVEGSTLLDYEFVKISNNISDNSGTGSQVNTNLLNESFNEKEVKGLHAWEGKENIESHNNSETNNKKRNKLLETQNSNKFSPNSSFIIDNEELNTNSFIRELNSDTSFDLDTQIKEYNNINNDIWKSQDTLSFDTLRSSSNDTFCIENEIRSDIHLNSVNNQIKSETQEGFNNHNILNISKVSFANMKIIGQFNSGFILVSYLNSLLVVDQHAADEIFNYERFVDKFGCKRDVLLSPLIVPDNLVAQLNEYKIQVLRNYGFVVKNELLVEVPNYKNACFGIEEVAEIIENDFSTKIHDLCASNACRSSVMIGEKLNKKKIESIVRNLSTLRDPWKCPHGRPVFVVLKTFNNIIK
ncbi:DNA mismatch repair protein pms1 [Cucumispora dikerogammari]|nr:DNA mismatch repair protein pms1 [Cucumispora dikerogammari]